MENLSTKQIMFNKFIEGQINFKEFLKLTDTIKTMEKILNQLELNHKEIKEDQVEREYFFNEIFWRMIDSTHILGFDESLGDSTESKQTFYSDNYKWDITVKLTDSEFDITHTSLEVVGKSLNESVKPTIEFHLARFFNN